MLSLKFIARGGEGSLITARTPRDLLACTGTACPGLLKADTALKTTEHLDWLTLSEKFHRTIDNQTSLYLSIRRITAMVIFLSSESRKGRGDHTSPVYPPPPFFFSLFSTVPLPPLYFSIFSEKNEYLSCPFSRNDTC